METNFVSKTKSIPDTVVVHLDGERTIELTSKKAEYSQWILEWDNFSIKIHHLSYRTLICALIMIGVVSVILMNVLKFNLLRVIKTVLKFRPEKQIIIKFNGKKNES